MPNLLDLLADGAGGRHELISAEGRFEDTTSTEMWMLADLSSQAFALLATDRLGVVMSDTPAMLCCVFGGWLAGLDVVSLPLPGRGSSLDDYGNELRRLCSLTDVNVVVAEDEGIASLLLAVGLQVLHPRSLLTRGGPGRRTSGSSEFVQCSSGTTGAAKAVRLTQENLGNNVAATLEGLGLVRDDCLLSWLPLSHDMGFVGAALCSWVGASPRLAGRTRRVAMSASRFVADPRSWLVETGRHRPTLLHGPPFALQMTRRTSLAKGLVTADAPLASVRSLMVGGDVILPQTCRDFDDFSRPLGARSEFLMPAYGMAEIGVAAALHLPCESWESRRFSVDRSHTVEMVSCGRVVQGVALQSQPIAGSEVGDLVVAGDSLSPGYIGGDGKTPGTTGDVGVLADDGKVYLLGRSDDLLKIGGQMYSAAVIEECTALVEGVRAGTTAAVGDTAGRLVVLVEVADTETAPRVTAAVIAAVRNSIGIVPAKVICLPRGEILKTPTGKLRRALLRSTFT